MDYLPMIARQLQITPLIGDQIESVLQSQKLLNLNEKVQVSLPLIPARRTKRKFGLWVASLNHLTIHKALEWGIYGQEAISGKLVQMNQTGEAPLSPSLLVDMMDPARIICLPLPTPRLIVFV